MWSEDNSPPHGRDSAASLYDLDGLSRLSVAFGESNNNNNNNAEHMVNECTVDRILSGIDTPTSARSSNASSIKLSSPSTPPPSFIPNAGAICSTTTTTPIPMSTPQPTPTHKNHASIAMTTSTAASSSSQRSSPRVRLSTPMLPDTPLSRGNQRSRLSASGVSLLLSAPRSSNFNLPTPGSAEMSSLGHLLGSPTSQSSFPGALLFPPLGSPSASPCTFTSPISATTPAISIAAYSAACTPKLITPSSTTAAATATSTATATATMPFSAQNDNVHVHRPRKTQQRRTTLKSNSDSPPVPSRALSPSFSASASPSLCILKPTDSSKVAADAFAAKNQIKKSKARVTCKVRPKMKPTAPTAAVTMEEDAMELRLVPCDDDLRRVMEDHGYNPHLELVVRPRKRVVRVLQHLQTKWARVCASMPAKSSLRLVGVPDLSGNNNNNNNKELEKGWDLRDTRATCKDVSALLNHPAEVLLRYTWETTKPPHQQPKNKQRKKLPGSGPSVLAATSNLGDYLGGGAGKRPRPGRRVTTESVYVESQRRALQHPTTTINKPARKRHKQHAMHPPAPRQQQLPPPQQQRQQHPSHHLPQVDRIGRVRIHAPPPSTMSPNSAVLAPTLPLDLAHRQSSNERSSSISPPLPRTQSSRPQTESSSKSEQQQKGRRRRRRQPQQHEQQHQEHQEQHQQYQRQKNDSRKQGTSPVASLMSPPLPTSLGLGLGQSLGLGLGHSSQGHSTPTGPTGGTAGLDLGGGWQSSGGGAEDIPLESSMHHHPLPDDFGMGNNSFESWAAMDLSLSRLMGNNGNSMGFGLGFGSPAAPSTHHVSNSNGTGTDTSTGAGAGVNLSALLEANGNSVTFLSDSTSALVGIDA